MAMISRIATLVVLVGCASAPRPIPVARWQPVTLTSTAGATATYPRDFAAAPYTVFVFFAASCPCFGMHEARLHELTERYRARGVKFVVVDSEVGRTVAGDAREAAQRGLPDGVYLDAGAKLAGRLGAVYATYSVVIAADGTIAYRGGIDSDKSHLRDDRTNYLADALDDLIAGKPPRRAQAKTLGCVLQTW